MFYAVSPLATDSYLIENQLIWLKSNSATCISWGAYGTHNVFPSDATSYQLLNFSPYVSSFGNLFDNFYLPYVFRHCCSSATLRIPMQNYSFYCAVSFSYCLSYLIQICYYYCNFLLSLWWVINHKPKS